MNANGVICHRCLASPGQLCTEVSLHGTQQLKQVHPERENLARLGPCTHCGAAVGEPCFHKKKGILLYEHWSRMECLAVRCDWCRALPGNLCLDAAGKVRGPHKCRVDAGKAAGAR